MPCARVIADSKSAAASCWKTSEATYSKPRLPAANCSAPSGSVWAHCVRRRREASSRSLLLVICRMRFKASPYSLGAMVLMKACRSRTRFRGSCWARIVSRDAFEAGVRGVVGAPDSDSEAFAGEPDEIPFAEGFAGEIGLLSDVAVACSFGEEPLRAVWTRRSRRMPASNAPTTRAICAAPPGFFIPPGRAPRRRRSVAPASGKGPRWQGLRHTRQERTTARRSSATTSA